MKRLLLLSILFLLTNVASATWTRVQHPAVVICTTTSATCDITVTSTGAGHVLFVGMTNNVVSAGGITAVSGGGTWSLCAASGCQGTTSTNRLTDIAYCLASTSGATTITVSRTNTTSVTWTVQFDEWSYTGSSVALDQVGVRSQSASASPFDGVTLPTLTGTNDVIYQVLQAGQNFSTENTALYNVDASSTTHAFFSASNTTDETPPNYTLSSASTAAMSAIAVKEITSATTTKVRVVQY